MICFELDSNPVVLWVCEWTIESLLYEGDDRGGRLSIQDRRVTHEQCYDDNEASYQGNIENLCSGIERRGKGCLGTRSHLAVLSLNKVVVLSSTHILDTARAEHSVHPRE